jgi:hypothetical protein
MKREFLQRLELADDIVDQIMAEHGKDIEKHKSRLAEAETKLATFDSVDVEELRRAAREWQDRAEQIEAKSRGQLEALRFDFALEGALTAAGAKNSKAVRALLDDSAMSLEGDELIGVSEQLEALQADAPYLFQQESPAAGFAYTPVKGAGNPDFALLSDDEFYRLSLKD